MSPGFNLEDYVSVAERIMQFVEAYPEGSLQSEVIELTETRVTVKAYAYRSPSDPRPGVGHASEEIPGRTPYTEHSELENAETSAWGRAIAGLGFSIKRGIASRDEHEAKRGSPWPDTRKRTKQSPKVKTYEERRAEVLDLAALKGVDRDALQVLAESVGVQAGTPATLTQLETMRKHLDALPDEEIDNDPTPTSPPSDEIAY